MICLFLSFLLPTFHIKEPLQQRFFVFYCRGA
nr:MAG TPA: hypothetical protein [Caudoviricetes sp.]